MIRHPEIRDALYENEKNKLRLEMKRERLQAANRCCALETTGYHPQVHICARRSGHHDYDTGFHWKWDKEEETTK